MGLFNFFKKKPVAPKDPKVKTEPSPQKNQNSSWIDTLKNDDGTIHQKLNSLAGESISAEAPPEKPTIKADISVTIKHVYEELPVVGALSRLNFAKDGIELGRFLNYEAKVYREPTEKQLQYAKKLGIEIPDGTTNVDISCMISRATGDDSLESPAEDLAAYATASGLKFSAYIGSAGLLNLIVNELEERELAAFYIYAINQSTSQDTLGDLRADPKAQTYYAFADTVLQDTALLRSLKGRSSGDLLSPHKGTAIYKAAASFLDTNK